MGVEDLTDMASGKRTARRARVLLAAKLQTPCGEIEAKLKDLSQKGALVECDTPLEVGSELIFSRGDTNVASRVAWSGGKKLGLEFLEPIDESEVLVQLNRTNTNSAPQRFRRPALRGESLTRTERQLAKVWGVAVGISISSD